MKSSGVRPTTHDTLLCVSHALQSSFQSGPEARIMQMTSAQPTYIASPIREICFACIGGSVLSILTKFLLNRSKHDMMVNVVSGVPQGSVPPVHHDAFFHSGE